MIQRCDWAGGDPQYLSYHDQEWGTPVHDDKLLFEFLTLEGAQAGLSWSTILRKRPAYRVAYKGFDPRVVANFNEDDILDLLSNPGIIRNRLKINSSITNAQAYLKIQKEFGSFDAYMWGFVGGKPRINKWVTLSEIPAQTEESQKMSKDLIQRGFKFVGPTIIYAHMQAVGMVNDHVTSCFRYKELSQL